MVRCGIHNHSGSLVSIDLGRSIKCSERSVDLDNVHALGVGRGPLIDRRRMSPRAYHSFCPTSMHTHTLNLSSGMTRLQTGLCPVPLGSLVKSLLRGLRRL